MRRLSLLVVLTLAVACQATIFFQEAFDKDWENRWVYSDWKKNEGTAGKFKWTAGDWYGDPEADKGIQTSEDARFYTISAKMPKPFSSVGKDLIFQFQIKHPQNIDCGGGYIKLLPSGLNQKDFKGDSEYAIMFGPDICGYTTRKVHAIFTYKGKNLLINKEVKAETDRLSHVYTLIVHPDLTYEIRIDNKKVQSGKLEEDWSFLLPKEIKDPAAKKPDDWDENAKIPDPTDKKPDDWDKIPKTIPDPNAKKPEDWNEEDGEWVPPTIPNPEYKGDWSPKMIANPNYKGIWNHPMIPNPEYKADPSIGQYENLEYVGIEIWQVKAGTLFDNIIVTDTVSEAESFFESTWGKNHSKEKAMFDESEKAENAKREEERKKAEEESKKAGPASTKEDEEDEDEEEEEDDKKKKEEL